MKEEKRKLFGFKLLKKDRERAEKGREKGKEKANERESGSAKSRAKMEKQDEKRRKQAEAEEEKRKRQAEVKLMKTPDSELTPIERVEKKRLLKDNEERAKAAANQMYFA
jgi:chromatin assembly factor 1 subunit A